MLGQELFSLLSELFLLGQELISFPLPNRTLFGLCHVSTPIVSTTPLPPLE